MSVLTEAENMAGQGGRGGGVGAGMALKQYNEDRNFATVRWAKSS